ncbi:MAG: hypothetical protein ABRQ38_16620 [Candidatus Eremiobacterota bacterium]
MNIMEDLAGKNYILSSNSGDLYIVPEEFIRDYTEEESINSSDKIFVFDAENIYEIPCEILRDYRMSDEEKRNFQERLMAIEPDTIEPSILHRGRLILFEYILSDYREKSDVHGYGVEREKELEMVKENQELLKKGYKFPDKSSDIYDRIKKWY